MDFATIHSRGVKNPGFLASATTSSQKPHPKAFLAVQQRSRNGVQHVGGAQEQDVGEVYGYLGSTYIYIYCHDT